MAALDHSLEIGKLQEQVAAVRRDNDRMAESLERIEKDVRQMALVIQQAQGGWKMLVGVAGASSVVGGFITTSWHWLSSKGGT
jgi:hypothetical protein